LAIPSCHADAFRSELFENLSPYRSSLLCPWAVCLSGTVQIRRLLRIMRDVGGFLYTGRHVDYPRHLLLPSHPPPRGITAPITQLTNPENLSPYRSSPSCPWAISLSSTVQTCRLLRIMRDVGGFLYTGKTCQWPSTPQTPFSSSPRALRARDPSIHHWRRRSSQERFRDSQWYRMTWAKQKKFHSILPSPCSSSLRNSPQSMLLLYSFSQSALAVVIHGVANS
jgi:hypothetical protein